MKKIVLAFCLVLALGLAAHFVLNALKERIRDGVAEALAARKDAVSVGYRSLEPEILGQRLVFTDLTFALPGQLALLMGKIAHLEVSRGATEGSLHARYSGLSLTLPDPGDFDLARLGLTPADLAAEGELTLTLGAGQRFTLEDAVLRVPRLGSLKLSLRLDGVDAAALGHQGLWVAASFVRVRALSLSYEDASLAGRIMASSASAANVTPEDYRAGLARAVPGMLAALLGPPASEREQAVLDGLAPVLAAFFRGARGLALDLQPEAPMTLAECLSFAPLESAVLLRARLDVIN